MLFESHAHLDDSVFHADRPEVIQQAYEQGVRAILNVGADLPSSRASVELAGQYPHIVASCGVHPHEADSFDDHAEEQLLHLLSMSRVVAVGEIGLDYYYNHAIHSKQKEAFRRQIRIARGKKLPLILHNREAHKDILDILEEENGDVNKGVFHCYSGSTEMVRQILRKDYFLSFTGVVTYRNAKKVLEALRAVPLERLLLETDSPYLSPEPFRGKRNHPGNLPLIARQIAAVKGVEPETIHEITWKNALEVFPDFTIHERCVTI